MVGKVKQYQERYEMKKLPIILTSWAFKRGIVSFIQKELSKKYFIHKYKF